MLKLYGSIVSPFVRRVRLLLHGHEHEFVLTDIYDDAIRQEVMKQNPSMKIPMLVDNETVVFDSGVIYRYLREIMHWSPLSWEQENLVTTINAANDSLVTILMSSRSGLDITDKTSLLFKLQYERLDIGFKALDDAVSDGKFSGWDYPEICLYCLLDWMVFRELYDIHQHTHLKRFWQQHQSDPAAIDTDPRGA
ncbi:MAG: glutathione S-transferase N-terminal domain-containing protein [Pseudomonadota bacterium]